jgi:ArsR family transcriptional regulator
VGTTTSDTAQPRGRRTNGQRSRTANHASAEATQAAVRVLARVLRALGDESRLRIIAWLSHGELCVCHLEKALELSQPNVSRQLAVLRAAGVVESRREGTWVYYLLSAQEHPAAAAMLGALVKSFAEDRAIRTEHPRLRKSCGPEACR